MNKTKFVITGGVLLAAFILIYFAKMPETLKKKSTLEHNHQVPQQLIRAEGYIKEGKLNEAKMILLNRVEEFNYEEKTYYWLSFIFVQEEQFDRAFDFIKPLVEKTTDARILTDIGSILAMKGYSQAAFSCYGKAVNVDSEYIPAYIELGKHYGNQEKFIQAINVWQDGLRKDPANKEIVELIKQANLLWEKQSEDLETVETD